ncbi:hypothetical protein BG006_003998 [Podila minutissima]|uniref:Uncharacterized protein n=1 Tax=Podila minutissima TaxID=64525 RepID=A0A9P5SPU5_9FUNG|nr:hypothetical protein BG006_003998 [Podila minutissima]
MTFVFNFSDFDPPHPRVHCRRGQTPQGTKSHQPGCRRRCRNLVHLCRQNHLRGRPAVGHAGRLKKLPDETVDELVREHQIGEIKTCAEASDHVNEMLNEPVSYSTIRRSMHGVEDA